MSLRTHSRVAYATADFKVGAYETREGRAIPTLLAYQLERGGYGEWFFQWRSRKRPKPLSPTQLHTADRIRDGLRAEARKVPCARPIRLNNNVVLMG